MKAIALFSGGLDSILAVKLVERQGIDVIPVHFYTWFTGHKEESFVKMCAKEYGIRPIVVDVSQKFLDVLFAPKYGYGQGMNPCIDCKIFFFREAKRIMEEREAKFIVSGEVVGQRPMSQRKDTLKLIEKESGLEGLILRPLSAKVLPETLPEKLGWVDRNALEGIQGRGRKRQLELAREFGIKSIPSPAGGCILTDPTFSKRLKILMEVVGRPSLDEIRLLRLGRMFRLKGCILIIGRNERENQILSDFDRVWRSEDGKVTAVAVGETTGKERTIAGIILRYARIPSGRVVGPEGTITAEALPPEEVHSLLV